MTLLSWILIGFGSLMYLEGFCVAGLAGVVLKPSKFLWPLLLLLWPIILPMMAYKTFAKYWPIIQELQKNPLLGAMFGMGPPQQSPVAAILGKSTAASVQPVNPFELLLNPTQSTQPTQPIQPIQPIQIQDESEKLSGDKEGDQ